MTSGSDLETSKKHHPKGVSRKLSFTPSAFGFSRLQYKRCLHPKKLVIVVIKWKPLCSYQKASSSDNDH